MKLARILPLTLPLFFVSCASTTSHTVASDSLGKSASAEDEARELDELQRKLEITQAKLSVAQLEAAAFDAKHETRLRHASAEVGMAKAKLAQFDEADAPNRLAKEQLNLRTSKDRAQEAAEELAQIEIMYKDQDLDDVTAEFVVSRGRRSAERAAKRLEIQESELRAIEERTLPREREQLQLALDKATAALGDAEREGEIGQRQKQIAIQQAENEAAKLEADLAEKAEKKEEAQP